MKSVDLQADQDQIKHMSSQLSLSEAMIQTPRDAQINPRQSLQNTEVNSTLQTLTKLQPRISTNTNMTKKNQSISNFQKEIDKSKVEAKKRVNSKTLLQKYEDTIHQFLNQSDKQFNEYISSDRNKRDKHEEQVIRIDQNNKSCQNMMNQDDQSHQISRNVDTKYTHNPPPVNQSHNYSTTNNSQRLNVLQDPTLQVSSRNIVAAPHHSLNKVHSKGAVRKNSIKTRFKGYKLSQIKSLSNSIKSSSMTRKLTTTDGFRSGAELSVQNQGGDLAPKLGSFGVIGRNKGSNVASIVMQVEPTVVSSDDRENDIDNSSVQLGGINDRRNQMYSIANKSVKEQQYMMHGQINEGQLQRKIQNTSLYLVADLVKNYKKTKTSNWDSSMNIKGENIQEKINNSKMLQKWVENEQQKYRSLRLQIPSLIQKQNDKKQPNFLANSQTGQKKHYYSAQSQSHPIKKVNVHTLVNAHTSITNNSLENFKTSVEDDTLNMETNAAPAPILTNQIQEDSIFDRPTTRGHTPQTTTIVKKKQSKFIGNSNLNLCNIGSPRGKQEIGNMIAEDRRDQRNNNKFDSYFSQSLNYPPKTSLTSKNKNRPLRINTKSYNNPFHRSVYSDVINLSMSYVSGNQSSPLSYTNRNFINYHKHLLFHKNAKKDPTYIFSKNVSPQSAAEKIMRRTAFPALNNANGMSSLLNDEISKLTTPSASNSFKINYFFTNPPSPKITTTPLVRSLDADATPKQDQVFKEQSVPIPKSPLWSMKEKEKFIHSGKGREPNGYLIRHKHAYREKLLQKFSSSVQDPRINASIEINEQRSNLIRVKKAQGLSKSVGCPEKLKNILKIRKGKVFMDKDFDVDLCNGKYRKI